MSIVRRRARSAVGGPESKLRELLATHDALRRIAALIARGAQPSEVFAAVTGEVKTRFRASTARLIRYETDGTVTVVANEGTVGPHARIGCQWNRFPDHGLTSTVWRTGQPARVDDYRAVVGGEPYVREGLVAAVAAPIFVHGNLWGLIAIGSTAGPLPSDAENRLADFASLTATAIATAHGRAEVEASRSRIVLASDESRRRIERDLHDGAQQQLVALALTVTTLSECGNTPQHLRNHLQQTAAQLLQVIDNLREIARGIHPAILSEAGLVPALRELATRSPIPAQVTARVCDGIPQPVAAGAYYVVSEALANTVKHSRATHVRIDAVLSDDMLEVVVTDDGIGGADRQNGTGLVGLYDRVEALGGRMSIDSTPGEGTRIYCALPVYDVTSTQGTSRRPEPVDDRHRYRQGEAWP